MKNAVSWSRFFLIFTILGMNCYAQEILNIETLPTLRTNQYSTQPYKKIVVFSAPRTGSSLVYNVFRFLFEDETNLSSYHNEFNQDCFVLKTHKFPELDLLSEENVLYIITIRNPIDACVSNYRICPRNIKDVKSFAKKVMHKHRDYLMFCERMKDTGRNVIFIKYEDFEDNLAYLFDFIENHFLISIAEPDKNLIKNGYGKENVFSSIQVLPDFKKSLPVSGFHGKHVTLEKYIPPGNLLYWLNYYLSDVKPVFKKYGYFPD